MTGLIEMFEEHDETSPPDRDERDREIGRPSLWLLRLATAATTAVVFAFIIDAIRG